MIPEKKELELKSKSIREMRKFAVLMAVCFAFLGLFFSKKNFAVFLEMGMFGVSIFFVFFGVVAPKVLAPIYKGWMIFGGVLGLCVSKVILFVLYYGVFSPMAFLRRSLGEPLLDTRFKDQTASSYWVLNNRDPRDEGATSLSMSD